MTKLADVAKRAVWPALVFNLCNEPAFKFNLCVFGDKSNDIQSRTSYFTQKQVIYLETLTSRYEICRKVESKDKDKDSKVEDPEMHLKEHQQLYTFSRVLNCRDLDNEFFSLASTKVPLETKYKEVIADNLDWHDMLWSDNELRVVKEVPLKEDANGGAGLAAGDPSHNQTVEKTIGLYTPLMNFKLYDIRDGGSGEEKW